MSDPKRSERFQQALAEIDRFNANDPRSELCDGVPRPREVVYSERLTVCLECLYPDASELLRLAARAQHIGRWQIVRDRYPVGRDGYNEWRAACRDHHATLTRQILVSSGYADAEIAHVEKLIRKEDLKRDAESQALENSVGVAFVEHFLAAFVDAHRDYDDQKLLGILRKTMRKLDPVGHAAIRTLALPEPIKRLVMMAMDGKG